MFGRNETFTLHAHGQVAGRLMSLDYRLLFADGSSDSGTTIIAIETGNGP
jgi:hypothetical protein